MEGEHCKEVIKPHSWIYATEYKGTARGHTIQRTWNQREVLLLKTNCRIKEFPAGGWRLDQCIPAFPAVVLSLGNWWGALIRIRVPRGWQELHVMKTQSRQSKFGNLMHALPFLFTELRRRFVCKKLVLMDRNDPSHRPTRKYTRRIECGTTYSPVEPDSIP